MKNVKIIKETIWSFLTKGLTLILLFAINIILARKLGKETYGEWTFLFSIITIIALVSFMGINLSAKKFIAQYNGTKKVYAIIKSSLKLRILISLTFSVIIIIFHNSLAKLFLVPQYSQYILLASILVFFMGLVEYFKEVFTGLHDIKYNFMINITEYGFKIIFLILFFSWSVSIYEVIESYILASIISAICGLAVIWKLISKEKKNHYNEIWKYGLPLFLISIGFAISTEISTIMLGLLKNSGEVGIFAVAKQIIYYLPQISQAIIIGTMPIFAKLNEENKRELKAFFIKVLKINTWIFIPVTLFLIISSKFFIPLLFGVQYGEAWKVTMYLIPYMLIASYSAYFGAVLDYVGLAKKRAINLMVAILLSILLNFLLIPPLGAIGAAIATSCAPLPYFILNWIEVKKVLF